MFDFTEKVGTRKFDLVADALHGGVGKTIQGKCIETLCSAIAESGAYPQFTKEDPLGGPGVKRGLNNVEQLR